MIPKVRSSAVESLDNKADGRVAASIVTKLKVNARLLKLGDQGHVKFNFILCSSAMLYSK